MGILAYVAYKRSDTTTNQVFIPGWIGNYFYQCQSQPACQTSDFTPAKKNVLGWFRSSWAPTRSIPRTSASTAAWPTSGAPATRCW
jgi:hypothetical protein